MLHRTKAWRLAVTALLALALIGTLSGCTTSGKSGAAKPERLVLASTTSTQDSGLFDVLIPAFEKANPGQRVEVVAVGTGEALELGERKDADVLLVHARSDEEEFVSKGFGTERRDVMYNDFVIAGSPDDPGKVKGSQDATAALASLAAAGAKGTASFVSRGDDSGTHKKELKLWKAAGISPSGAWYLSTGQGMGESLRVADEKRAYILVDRATYLATKDDLELDIVLENSKDLLNEYGVIPVAGARNPEGAKAFAEWITGPEGQKVIGEFGVEKFGQAIFTPSAK